MLITKQIKQLLKERRNHKFCTKKNHKYISSSGHKKGGKSE